MDWSPSDCQTPQASVAGFSGLRAGLGISWQGIGVDYAFAPYGKLGMTHRISLSYRGPAATDEVSEE